MVRRCLALTLLSCIASLTAVVVPAAEELPIGRLVGEMLADFRLRDATTGREVSLHGLARVGKTAAVLVFTGTDCPVGNAYMPRLVELADTYAGRGVALLAINSNASESDEDVSAHAREYQLNFPVLLDPKNVVADQCLVERTCETILIDRKGRVRYRGAIDDQFSVTGAKKPVVGHHYLCEAIDAVLADRDVETTATTVVGCPIERTEITPPKVLPRIRPAAKVIVDALNESAPEVEVGPVTYAKDVAPIVQARCQGCHRPGQVAPFSLRNYDDARRWAATIREVVDQRRMPPWHADPRFGHFSNDRSLSARERAVLLAWVDQGAPAGDPADLPEPKTWPEGWTVGEPDVVFQIPEEFIVPAQGEVPYKRFRVPTNFKEDRWVQSIEARPGDRSVVHHIIVYLDDKSGKPGRPEHLGGYAPGDMPSVYEPGTGKLIPAGSDLVFELHYTPIGKVRTDRSSVGFIFSKEPPTKRAITRAIANNKLVIPPGAPDYEVKSRLEWPEGAELLAFMPHMHLRGKDFQYQAQIPGQPEPELLLSVPAYDFGWQSYYRLAEPRRFPKGTQILCTAHFDNSDANPANPDPEVEVRWGDQTWEEMMIGYVDYVVPIEPKAPEFKTTERGGLLRDLRALGRAAQRRADSRRAARPR